LINLLVDKNKRLRLHSTTSIYQYENKFDVVHIVCPQVIDGNNILDYTAQLHILNEQGEADVILIDFTKISDKLIADVDIINLHTQTVCTLALYIEFFNAEASIGYTNAVSLSINTLPMQTGQLTEAQLTMLNQYSIKFSQIQQALERDWGRKADGLSYTNNDLQLTSNGKKIGTPVAIIGGGTSIASAVINSAGHLIITYSDGTVIDCGQATGEKGEKGDTGEKGEKGDTGVAGAAGENATINGITTLTLVPGENIALKQSGNTLSISAAATDLSNYYTKVQTDSAISTAINSITNGDEVSY
jgi:hypothetical protein